MISCQNTTNTRFHFISSHIIWLYDFRLILFKENECNDCLDVWDLDIYSFTANTKLTGHNVFCKTVSWLSAKKQPVFSNFQILSYYLTKNSIQVNQQTEYRSVYSPTVSFTLLATTLVQFTVSQLLVRSLNSRGLGARDTLAVHCRILTVCQDFKDGQLTGMVTSQALIQ